MSFKNNIYKDIFLLLFFLFNDSCPHCPPIALPCPAHPPPPHSISPSFVLVHVSFTHFP